MAETNNLIPTEPDWDGTPMSRSEEILYSIIHTEEWDGTPMSRGEYFLAQLKDAIENISMMDIKGTVPTVADLPSTGNKKGDVYSVGPDEQLNKPEYYWDGESWQYLGQIVDLSGYLPLTGGTMTGDLNFNIGGTTVRVGANGSYPFLVGGGTNNGPFEIVGLNGLNLIPNSGSVTIGQSGNPALTSNGNVTSVWGGNSMEVKSPISTTIKGHKNNGADTNTITLNSTGITETTTAKKVVTTATGIELDSSASNHIVMVSSPNGPLTASSPAQIDINSGGNLNLTGYGNTTVTATAGEAQLIGSKGYVSVVPNGVVRVVSDDGLELGNSTQNATTTTIKTNGQSLSLRTTGAAGIAVEAAGSAGLIAQHGSVSVASVESSTTVAGNSVAITSPYSITLSAINVTLNGNPLRATLLLTQAEYDALATKDPNVVYNIYEPEEGE